MKVLAIQLNSTSQPLLNNNYISVENPNYGDYDLKLEKDFVTVSHKTKGIFVIPLTAISWMKIEKVARGRPKKVA
jgi:hypothetical protein